MLAGPSKTCNYGIPFNVFTYGLIILSTYDGEMWAVVSLNTLTAMLSSIVNDTTEYDVLYSSLNPYVPSKGVFTNINSSVHPHIRLESTAAEDTLYLEGSYTTTCPGDAETLCNNLGA